MATFPISESLARRLDKLARQPAKEYFWGSVDLQERDEDDRDESDNELPYWML